MLLDNDFVGKQGRGETFPAGIGGINTDTNVNPVGKSGRVHITVEIDKEVTANATVNHNKW